MEKLKYEKFLKDVLDYVEGQAAADRGELKAKVPYGRKKKAIICPEPILFIEEFGKLGNNREACRELFERKARDFAAVSLPEHPPSGLWWNTTREQINLRPGIQEAKTEPLAVSLGDVTVHGLIAGQTGSGKSVLLHSLIFGLLAEYPPWELDLYLADFKRVEFSRYMDGKSTAPHVAACAATGEVRYVLSLIQHLVDCMNAREDFFKKMGFEKIAKFRKYYEEKDSDIILPRILLIVDEFQQLFLEASAKENEQIHRMLTAIVKKGRATGVHILFASQEMSQTLSRSDLANFRMRIALNCDPNVSMDVLGNRKAAECPVGKVYVNFQDYTEATNQLFLVPMAESEQTEEERNRKEPAFFDKYLRTMAQCAAWVGFRKNSKFYQEDYQEPIEELTPILRKIVNYRKEARKQCFDALTLGRNVTFSPLKYDIQTLFLERGRNRNILAVSSDVEDLAYLQRLLALNFRDEKDESGKLLYHHRVFSFMPVVETLYHLDGELSADMKEKGTDVKVWRNPEDFDVIERRFAWMRFVLPQFQEADSPLEFAILNYRRNVEQEIRRRPDLKESRLNCIPIIAETFKDISFENYVEITSLVREKEGSSVLGKIADNISAYCRYRSSPLLVFPPTIIWITGIDTMERLPEWFLWMMKNGMDYNLLFVCMAGSEFDNMTQLSRCCDYLFLGGTNRRIYDRLGVNFTQRDVGSIALDLHVKSSGEERSFKKYRCSFGRKENLRIPFEELLDA